MCGPEVGHRTRGKRTLIIIRSTLTEPKMALAGATLEISFARFNKERALSCHFWRRTQALMQIGGNFVTTCLVQTVPPDQDSVLVVEDLSELHMVDRSLVFLAIIYHQCPQGARLEGPI